MWQERGVLTDLQAKRCKIKSVRVVLAAKQLDDLTDWNDNFLCAESTTSSRLLLF